MSATRRVLLWSGNRTTGTTQSYTIVLPFRIEKAVKLEWVSSSFPGYMLSIQDWNQSVSSSGVSYWRFVDAYSNQRQADAEYAAFETKTTPVAVQTLKLAWFNPDGTVAALVPEHTLEIEVTCLFK